MSRVAARTKLFVAALTVLAGAGCARPAPYAKLPRVSQREWDRGRATLFAARAELPKDPYTLVVAVDMIEARTGHTFSARGGLAVLPGKAVRLQLLGPGGATALDAWLTRERFRFDVPAANVHKRGAVAGQEAAGLPIGFFRFWFLSQLEGRLLFAKPTRDGTYFVIREGAATVEMFRAARGGHVEAERVVAASPLVEELSVDAAGVRPGAGDKVLYRASLVEGDRRVPAFAARVAIESVGDEAPDPAAFEEPP